MHTVTRPLLQAWQAPTEGWTLWLPSWGFLPGKESLHQRGYQQSCTFLPTSCLSTREPGCEPAVKPPPYPASATGAQISSLQSPAIVLSVCLNLALKTPLINCLLPTVLSVPWNLCLRPFKYASLHCLRRGLVNYCFHLSLSVMCVVITHCATLYFTAKFPYVECIYMRLFLLKLFLWYFSFILLCVLSAIVDLFWPVSPSSGQLKPVYLFQLPWRAVKTNKQKNQKKKNQNKNWTLLFSPSASWPHIEIGLKAPG